jgi:hypothetical protein
MYEQKRLLSDPGMVDIEAELSHWQSSPGALGVQANAARQSDVVATLKFAYDSYLCGGGIPLDERIVSLQEKYSRLVAEQNRLPWGDVDRILRAVWQKMAVTTAE